MFAKSLNVVVALTLTMILSIQIFATLVFNLPYNFFSARIGPTVVRIISPYFDQSWSLFAPNPGGGNASTFFRYAFVNDRGIPTMTPWIDGNGLFPASDSIPTNRLGLEREIYFGEVLIAANGAKELRKTVADHKMDLKHPIALSVLPDSISGVERLFMSLEPDFIPNNIDKQSPFFVQIALNEREPVHFGERFGFIPVKQQPESAGMMMPWVNGDYVSPFAQSVEHR